MLRSGLRASGTGRGSGLGDGVFFEVSFHGGAEGEGVRIGLGLGTRKEARGAG